jgi:hypothetical protein
MDLRSVSATTAATPVVFITKYVSEARISEIGLPLESFWAKCQ